METAMQRIRFLKPAAGLEQVVRFYAEREARVHGTDLVHPVPARAAPMLEFVFSDPFEIHWCDRPLVEITPRSVIIGLQTHRRVRLVTKGTLESFCIVFQPAGLFRLFSLPLHELTNHDCEARAVLGPSVSRLQERLGACGSLEERAQITDGFLLRLCLARPCSDGVSAAANEILLYNGQVRIAGFADRAGLSLRQFERRFTQQVGVRPKLYARIARFEAALDSKARSQVKSWTQVAHELGYHDQMHLVHDFEQFSGETPTHLLTEVEKAHRALIDAVRLGRMPAGQVPRFML
jgi:AraC-like DNA-binding protein